MKTRLFNLNHFYFFVCFVLLEVIIFYSLSYYKNQQINHIKKDYIQSLDTQLKSVISFFSITSQIAIDEILNQQSVQNLLLNLNSDDKEIQNITRNGLLEILNPTYERLSVHGFRQLHFQDINGNSFLRFHSVENFGDNVFSFRETILQANKTQKPQFGFEEGKILNGFRNVFPIFIDNNFYGTVELSNSFDSFSKILHTYFPFEYKLLITKEYVDSKVFPNLINKYYKPSSISDIFYEENVEDKNSITRSIINSNNLSLIEENLKNNINKELLGYKPFVKSFDINGNHYIATFLPIMDFNKTINTYIVSFIEENAINQVERNFYFLISFVNIIIVLFLLGYLSKQYSNEKNLFMTKAFIDSLTRLFSRTKFNHDLKEITIANELKYYSVIMFDIDHFKNVNDSYGHDVGDILLEEFASVTKSFLREDDLIYRWGGEEFIILIKNRSKENLLNIADKLRVVVYEHKFKVVGHMTASFGVAISRLNDTKESLLKRADQNLYKAKQSGRNCVVID